MKSHKTDRRSQRTRRLLATALLELLQRQGYDQITVQDIIQRADVGRATFYSHYEDKDDLLFSEMEAVLDQLFENVSLDGFGEPRQSSPIRPLFQHVKEHRDLYLALTWSRVSEPFFKKCQNFLSQKLDQVLTASAKYQASAAVPRPVLLTYLAGSNITLLRWWLENNMPYSPEQMDEFYHRLAMPGLWAALETKRR